ncbi:baseplate J/gp47 family protein [Nannocystis sp.]|uniref:baseplate J/gp47 family protein n=1 Tax=Nannocystis sp. TaxID=1962667 RepID=UPI0024299103|nr:baseplate J/gp47 family protein [Nannocystis sp.]MBK7828162.1 hypothetical protein [Nannocystis sp.]MBK9753601.1 hypothetical protein [Nannocystis sp.]
MSAIYDDKDTSFAGVVERLLGFAGRPGDAVGGVARTLLEAVAREFAIFYATLDAAHRAGFLDTAEASALDNVVAILGVTRARAGRLAGKVQFSRAVPAQQDIVIPAGRRVTGVLADKPLPLFETVEEVVLARGETHVIAEVQEVREEGSPPAPQLLNPDTLTIMPRPVLGVETVRNIEPLRQRQADESDEQLRARARTVLRESQRGTAPAIAAAVREQGVVNVEVREPADLPPGVLRVIISDPGFEKDLEARARVEETLRNAKPAGVRVLLEFQRSLYITAQIEVELVDAGLDDRARTRVADELRQILVAAARGLSPGAAVRRQKIEGPLLSHVAVAAVQRCTLGLRGVDLATRPQLPGGDLYVDAYESAVLEAADIKLTWFTRPALSTELVVQKAGNADSIRASVREVVQQYNAFIRSKGTADFLFVDLQSRLTPLGITITALSATRDGVTATEGPGDAKKIKLAADELVALGDVEVIA